jgi:hypothetical protein
MRTRNIFVMIAIFLILMAETALVKADCDPWGTSTLIGNAQYPPGWNTPSISIHPPDEYVFAVTDGSGSPQQFIYIKTKLQYFQEEIVLGAGKVTAVALYRKRIDYQPDLSTDPPTAASVEQNYSMSISAPVPVDTLPLFVSVPVTFDFSADPIPAGITDLELQVFFYGSVDQQINKKVILTGAIDLNEPMHLTYWNLMDYLAIFGNLLTIDEIYDTFTAEDWAQLESECGITDLYIAKYAHFYVGFGSVGSTSVIPVAYIEHLLPGQYSRLIVLTGGDQFMSRTYLKADGINTYWDWKETPQGLMEWEWYYSDPSDFSYIDNLHTGVVNRHTIEGFISTDPFTFRTLKTHFADYYLLSCPNYTRSELTNLYQNLAPDLYDPYPFSILNFP